MDASCQFWLPRLCSLLVGSSYLWCSVYALKGCNALSFQPEDLQFNFTTDAQSTSSVQILFKKKKK